MEGDRRGGVGREGEGRGRRGWERMEWKASASRTEQRNIGTLLS